MYLPPGLTFLRLLQLPLSLLSSDQPTSQLIHDEDFHGRKDLNNLGAISPYHDAPAAPRVSPDLPDDCTVNKVVLLHRHGSRGTYNEQSDIQGLVKRLHDASDIIQHLRLPPDLEFLKKGYTYDLPPQNLTIIGRKEMFDHGVEFALRYPTFSTDVVVSTDVQRVIDSAHFFSHGFFGREADKITFLTTNNFTDPVSWLLPWKNCTNLSPTPALETADQWAESYIPSIVKRLNKLVPGVGFTFNDTRGALYACPYDLAAGNSAPWCDVFTRKQLRGLEYQLDIYYDNFTGHWHESGPDAGPLVGAFYIKKLIERLTDTSENAKSLYLDFGHDVTLLVALSTMGLNKDAKPLSPDVSRPPARRKFRTSNQTPFAAEMVWEKFTCESSFEGPQIRLVLNRATFPLSICQRSKADKKYGTCSLDEFLRANEFSMNVQYHDETWDAVCGPGQ